MRTPRKTKKAIKKAVVVVDISAMPNCWDINQWLHAVQNYGLYFWDSKYGGHAPKLLSRNNKRVKIIKRK